MKRIKKLKELKKLIPDISFHCIEENGDIDFQEIPNCSKIRLASSRSVLKGDKNTLAKIIECVSIVGANEYELHIGGENYWIDFYSLTEEELKQYKIINLKRKIEELEK